MNMSQLRSDVRPAPVATPEYFSQSDAPGRLVVVIRAPSEEGPLAGRILEVAGGREVLLLGVDLTVTQEAQIRRALALLAAFLRHAGTSVTVRMEPGPDWVQRLRADLAPTDSVSCMVDESSATTGVPLHDVLSRALDRPVYIFAGQRASDEPAMSLARRVAPWLASLLVILGFLGIQIVLSRSPVSAGTNLLLVLTLPVEAGLLLLCNAFLS